MVSVTVAGRLEGYLRRHIPLFAAMEVSVARCDSALVELAAPLAPNVNHHGTMFGGSLSALALLTGWSAVHLALESTAPQAQIVVRHNTMDYLAPASGNVTARCSMIDEPTRERFLRTLRRLGKARVSLTVTLACRDTIVARFEGDYAAATGLASGSHT